MIIHILSNWLLSKRHLITTISCCSIATGETCWRKLKRKADFPKNLLSNTHHKYWMHSKHWSITKSCTETSNWQIFYCMTETSRLLILVLPSYLQDRIMRQLCWVLLSTWPPRFWETASTAIKPIFGRSVLVFTRWSMASNGYFMKTSLCCRKHGWSIETNQKQTIDSSIWTKDLSLVGWCAKEDVGGGCETKDWVAQFVQASCDNYFDS